MDTTEIKPTIRKSIARITGLDPEEITDLASYKEDLALDSLSILEIVVDLEYQFQVKVPEEELAGVRTVEDTARLVQRYLSVEVA